MARTFNQSNVMSPKVSSSITQGSSVTPTNVVAGESLAKDFMNMIGAGVQHRQTTVEGSKKMANAQANDAKNQLTMDLTAISATTTPETPEEETKAQINAAYRRHNKHGNLGLPEAQAEFEAVYTNPMAISTGHMEAKLEVQRKKKAAQSSIDYANMTANNNINLGVAMDSKDLESYTNAYTLYGYKTKEDAHKNLADVVNTGFATQLSTAGGLNQMLSAYGYDAKTGVTSQLKDTTFNATYSAFATMDGGVISWNKDLDEVTKNTVLKGWGTFEKAVGDTGDITDMGFLDAKSFVSKAKSQAATGKQTLAEMNENLKHISTLDPTFMPGTRDTKAYANYNNEILQLQKEAQRLSLVNVDLANGSMFIKNALDGTADKKDMVLYDPVTKEPYTLAQEYVKNVVKTNINNLEQQFKVGDDKSAAALKEIFRYSTMYGQESPMVMDMVKKTSGDSISFENIDEVKRFNTITGYAKTNAGYGGYATMRNVSLQSRAQAFIGQYDALESETAKQDLFRSFNSEISAIYSNSNSYMTNTAMRKKVEGAVTYASDTWLSTANVPNETGLGIGMMAAQMDWLSLSDEEVNSNIDAATFTDMSWGKTLFQSAMRLAPFYKPQQATLFMKTIRKDGTPYSSDEEMVSRERAFEEYNTDPANVNNTVDQSNLIHISDYSGANGADQVTQKYYKRNADGTRGDLVISYNGNEAADLLIRAENDRSWWDKSDRFLNQAYKKGFTSYFKLGAITALIEKNGDPVVAPERIVDLDGKLDDGSIRMDSENSGYAVNDEYDMQGAVGGITYFGIPEPSAEVMNSFEYSEGTKKEMATQFDMVNYSGGDFTDEDAKNFNTSDSEFSSPIQTEITPEEQTRMIVDEANNTATIPSETQVMSGEYQIPDYSPDSVKSNGWEIYNAKGTPTVEPIEGITEANVRAEVESLMELDSAQTKDLAPEALPYMEQIADTIFTEIGYMPKIVSNRRTSSETSVNNIIDDNGVGYNAAYKPLVEAYNKETTIDGKAQAKKAITDLYESRSKHFGGTAVDFSRKNMTQAEMRKSAARLKSMGYKVIIENNGQSFHVEW